MEENYLEGLKGKLILLVYEEEGQEKTLRGTLKGQDSDFLFIETYQNQLAIAKRDVRKIKSTINNGENNG